MIGIVEHSSTSPRGIMFNRPKTSRRSTAPASANDGSVRNVTERVTLDSLRDTQHKDADGNVICMYKSHIIRIAYANNAIAEPDLSNPTRPRWERPLDTIRSFEKAIDGGYKRRSMSRASTSYTPLNYKKEGLTSK